MLGIEPGAAGSISQYSNHGGLLEHQEKDLLELAHSSGADRNLDSAICRVLSIRTKGLALLTLCR